MKKTICVLLSTILIILLFCSCKSKTSDSSSASISSTEHITSTKDDTLSSENTQSITEDTSYADNQSSKSKSESYSASISTQTTNKSKNSVCEHYYLSTGRCSKCNEISSDAKNALEASSISFEKLPCDINCIDDYIVTTYRVTNITIDKQYYSGKIKFIIKITGYKTYDNRRDEYQYCELYAAIMDVNNNMVDCAFSGINSLTINEETEVMEFSLDVDPGKYYLDLEGYVGC